MRPYCERQRIKKICRAECVIGDTNLLWCEFTHNRDCDQASPAGGIA